MSFNYFDSMMRARKSYARMMEPLCDHWGLTRNEVDVLLFLANNPNYDRAVDIVNGRGMSKSHVSLSVNELESKGLLTRREDPEDRRTIRLTLTPKADAIVQGGRDVQKEFFSHIFAGITPEEMALWQDLTERVCRNIEAFED